jgi:hypothetical protein
MDSKKLAKLIKVIVEAEVAKKHEQFLTNTFPKVLEEEINRRVKTLLEAKGGVVAASALVEEEIDPFQKAEMLLQQERQEQPKKQFTKNATINEILNQTQPFTAEQRKGTTGTKSVLDQFQSVNESMDKTVSFGNQTAQLGVEGMRQQMAQQMGYGDINPSGTKKTGLGVQTGLAGLDRILNRDNSELVKRFKK